MSDSTDNIASNQQNHEAALPVLIEAERRRVLVEWNRTERDYPWDKCIHQLFEEQVRRTPDAVAMVFEGESLTYQELNTRANQLAHHLRSLGVGPEVLVGLCLNRSLEMTVALLSILKAGGAYVPMDPNYPEERLRFILKDAGLDVLLTHRSLDRLFPVSPPHVVYVDLPLSTSCFANDTACPISPGHLAYIIYTSGSTGVPKGVAIEHQSTVSFLYWVRETFTDEELSGVLAATSICFDLSVFEMFGPLCWGGKVILVNNALDLRTCCHRQEVKLLNTVPSVMQTLLNSEAMPSSVVTVNLAGEPLHPLLVDDLYACAHIRRVNDLYGPSETTTYSTMALRKHGQPATIGRPIANTQVYIVDPDLNPVPAGVEGELWIGGRGVARGYWQRPELTVQRFVPDRFGGHPNARLYRTGDRARWRPDGNLEFLGRLDLQVKIRGYRVELGEIESALCSFPEVRQAAVAVRDDMPDDKRLIAYLVAQNREQIETLALRSRLKKKLPDYMVPSAFVWLEQLPMTTNGKLDRKALIKLGGVELESGTEYVGPRNEQERGLAEIWGAVLRRKRVGIQDNFFDLGGHSLLAIVICSCINRRFNVEVPLRWMFEHPTIEELAEQLALQGVHLQNAGAIEKADGGKPLPMSFAQQRMWFLQQTLPDPATYNQPVAWRLSGRVERERIRWALQVIWDRHEVLRTSLVQQGDDLVQQVTSAKDFPLPWLEADLQSVPPNEQQAVLEERLLAEARRPFDLAKAPLWRAVWIKLFEDEQVLAITFHHSIIDEWSMRLFALELERLYAADGQVEGAGLTELPVQYADYAAWQRRRLSGEFLERQRDYWTGQLRDLPPTLELPADMARPLHPSGRGAVHDFQLAGPITTRMREFAREENTTLFTVMLTAYFIWLHRYTGQTDVIVGTPAANREEPGVQALLGLFLNTLPIRLRLDGNHTFQEVLRQVRGILLEAFSHANLPFEQMVALAVKDREAEQQLLFQVMFVLLEEALPALHLDHAQSRYVPLTTETSKSDLLLNIQASGETWECQLEYSTDLFTAETAGRMARHFTELLHSIVNNHRQPISTLQILPAMERQQVVVEWNRTDRDYPRDMCVHQLFEEQAERTPEAVAVVFGKQSLTYRELNQRANQLAHHLQLLGVETDVPVAVCLRPSLEFVVGVLSVLKAGGAYVPLDPEYPKERLAYMFKDTGTTVLLTRQEFLAQIPQPPGQIICLDGERERTGHGSGQNPSNAAGPESLAYIMYTSGSTGLPKGVAVPHRGINRLVLNTNYIRLDSSDRIAQVSNVSFDAATFEIWGALLNGAQLIGIERNIVLSPKDLAQELSQRGITAMFLTAALFNQIAREAPGAFRTLRTVISGGEAMDPECARAVLAHQPPQRLVNGYGPTENTAFTCCHEVRALDPHAAHVPIGRPITNTTVYILDPQLQPVPIGVAGELFAGGDGLARGYLNSPDLTAGRFIQNPFSRKPQDRLYRTGDMCRWLPEGVIQFLGRSDHQVKIRGYRIELGEIEMRLNQHPAIRESVVLAREDTPGDKRLVAYVTLKNGEPPKVSEWRELLKAQLPEYMLPSAFVTLKRFPLSPNGKVDRKALPKPEFESAAVEFVLPSKPTEIALAKIWCEVLGLKQVSLNDNFFDLGGHSLLAVRLQARVENELGRGVPLAVFFQAPTVRELAIALAGSSVPTHGLHMSASETLEGRPTLFYLHFLSQAQHLAKYFGPQWPVYGISAPYDEELHLWHEHHRLAISMEELAMRCLPMIQRLQPKGPYFLAGGCFGGVLAFEVACQLSRLGEETALLALLDAYYIPGCKRLQFPNVRRWTYHGFRTLSTGINYPLTKWRKRQKLAKERHRQIEGALDRDRRSSEEDSKRIRLPQAEFMGQILKQYKATPYAGGAVLIRSTADPSFAFDPGATNGWEAVIQGNLFVEDLNCGHADISEDPHITEAARRLEKYLSKAGAGFIASKALPVASQSTQTMQAVRL